MLPWNIRRKQIKHLLYEHCLSGRITMRLLKDQFNDLNNVEPVVHCKDCKWWDNDLDDCAYVYGLNCAEPENFCSHGERVDEVEE